MEGDVSEICGCKTMDDFVKDDEFMLFMIPILGLIMIVRCYTVW